MTFHVTLSTGGMVVEMVRDGEVWCWHDEYEERWETGPWSELCVGVTEWATLTN